MRRYRVATTTLLLLFLTLPFTAFTAPPRGWYEQQKQQATDHLNIQVFRVEKTKLKEQIEIKVEVAAEVIKVHSSKSGLSPGDVVVIKYHQKSKKGRPRIGPSYPPTLLIEEEYEAYLDKLDKTRVFRPAAAGASFKKI